MAHKAFVGTIRTEYLGQPGPQVITDNYLVIDDNDNIVGAPPNGTVLSQSNVPLLYNDSVLAIQNRVRDDIRSQYSDPNLKVIFVNGLGGLLNL